MRTDRAARLICPGVALVLRLIGLQFGLPAVYNPDEVAIMARALAFAKGTLNPHNFLYPTFYFYVLFAWVGVYLAVVWVTGRVASLARLPAAVLHRSRPASTPRAARSASRAGPQRWPACTVSGRGIGGGAPPAWRQRSSSRSRRCTCATRTTSSTTCRRRWRSSSPTSR